MHYNLVVCGGTFDHFHQGHAAFLDAALAVSEHILLGITSDEYVSKQKNTPSAIQSFEQRKSAVEAFLKKQHCLERVTIAPIESIFYPQAWETLPIEAIVVSEETKQGAAIINQHRETTGLTALPVYVIPLIADDKGEKIASTNIREGKINHQGTSYIQPSWFAHDLFLPEVEKQWFQTPFGELHKTNAFLSQENPETLITIGDVVTRDCNMLHMWQKLSVIDFTIQRKHTFQQIQELGFSGNEIVFRVSNPASHITTSLFQTIMQALTLFEQEKHIVIVVDGEEDLAVIPLVLALPLGFIVVYGQPKKGLVRLQVTTETKDKAYTLLQRFIEKKELQNY